MKIRNIDTTEFKKLLQDRASLEIIDVREPWEYDIIRIKDSRLIPMKSLPEHINQIDWSKTAVFICRTGSRSFVAASQLDGMPGAPADGEALNLKPGLYGCYREPNFPDLEIGLGVKTYF